MSIEFDPLRNFNYSLAFPLLWVFKKSQSPKKFTAYFVPIDQALNSQLKALIQNEMQRITEYSTYSHISQTNENSCLTIQQLGTDFEFLKAQVDRPETECGIRNVKDLKNATGYVVKFAFNNEVVYAVKRSTTSWKTAFPNRFINIVFSNGELSVIEDDRFYIERNFDFYGKGSEIFIANKKSFESILQYKQAYNQAFSDLQQNPDFSSLFSNLQPLISFVGSNSINLRRMAQIEQKGLYSRPNFLTKLQHVNNIRGWGINFDQSTNKIIACDQTAKTILQVLLDHRLMSEVTDQIYDVPDATQL